MTGAEKLEISANARVMEHLERIRCIAAEKMGFVERWEDARTMSASVPKIGILSEPQDYIDLDGNPVRAEDMDICCRMLSLGTMHKAYPMTYAVGTGSAAMIKGTIANDVARDLNGKKSVILGHTSGCTEVLVDMDGEEVAKAGVIRTARRIMDGQIYIR